MQALSSMRAKKRESERKNEGGLKLQPGTGYGLHDNENSISSQVNNCKFARNVTSQYSCNICQKALKSFLHIESNIQGIPFDRISLHSQLFDESLFCSYLSFFTQYIPFE